MMNNTVATVAQRVVGQIGLIDGKFYLCQGYGITDEQVAVLIDAELVFAEDNCLTSGEEHKGVTVIEDDKVLSGDSICGPFIITCVICCCRHSH